MPITETQREQRKAHLGSSDMAAVLGLDPYRTAHDVYLSKTADLQRGPANQAMTAGNLLERSVLDYAEERLGPLRRNMLAVVPQSPLAANVDAICDDTGLPVEAKTSGILFPTREWWGEDGSGEVPDRVVVQCHVHMLATETSGCHVPALVGGLGFRMYHLTRSDIIAETLLREANRFWTEHVEAGVPPKDSQPSLQIVKSIRRVPGKIVEIDQDLVQAWLDAKEAHKMTQCAKDEAEAAVLAAMDNAEAATCGALGAVTCYEQTRNGYVVKPTTFQVLRFCKRGL